MQDLEESIKNGGDRIALLHGPYDDIGNVHLELFRSLCSRNKDVCPVNVDFESYLDGFQKSILPKYSNSQKFKSDLKEFLSKYDVNIPMNFYLTERKGSIERFESGNNFSRDLSKFRTIEIVNCGTDHDFAEQLSSKLHFQVFTIMKPIEELYKLYTKQCPEREVDGLEMFKVKHSEQLKYAGTVIDSFTDDIQYIVSQIYPEVIKKRASSQLWKVQV